MESTTRVLTKAWHEALQQLDIEPVSPTSREVLDDLLGRYSQAGRYWHNREHLVGMLGTLKQWTDEPSAELVLATFFHDAIYRPGTRTNEVCSAELATRQLARLGVPEHRISSISDMILATRSHQNPEDRETALLLDADMAVLGSSPERYRAYTRAISREHNHLAPWAYKAGRGRFLLHTLFKRHIFHTPEGAKLNLRCRRNLIRELLTLIRFRHQHEPMPAERTRLALSTGRHCDLIKSGSHWVPGYQVLVYSENDKEPDADELEELASLAVRHARKAANLVLGSPDRYLLIQSGPGVRRVAHYHCHLIPLYDNAGKAGVYLFLAVKNFFHSVRRVLRG